MTVRRMRRGKLYHHCSHVSGGLLVLDRCDRCDGKYADSKFNISYTQSKLLGNLYFLVENDPSMFEQVIDI